MRANPIDPVLPPIPWRWCGLVWVPAIRYNTGRNPFLIGEVMNRNAIRIVVLGLVAAAIGWAVFSRIQSPSASESSKADGEDKPALVTTHTVEPRSLVDSLGATGTVRADESIAIRNEVPGKIVAIDFEEGDRVRKNDVLVRMRSNTLRAERRVNERRRELLERQLERQRKVLARGGVSEQEVDVTESELAVVRAQIDQVKAQIDETIVRAPFDGVVGIRAVSPGAVVTAGTRIADLRKIDVLDVEFSVPERHADRIRKGQEVRFRTYGDERLRAATVHAFDPGIDESNRTLRVQARAENTENDLRPGQFVRVRIVLERMEDALAVPSTAIVTSGEETSVWVNVEGKAKKRPVQTGFRNEFWVQITEGLSAGDQVVVTGRQGVEPGKALEIDDSEDAMDVDAIGPDPGRTGMLNEWFSEIEATQSREADQERDAGEGAE